MNTTTTEEVRQAAYWALREIQAGLTEEDLIRRAIVAVKRSFIKSPVTDTEREEIKKAMLCGGRFSNKVWEDAENIDYEFVKRHASSQAKEGV